MAVLCWPWKGAQADLALRAYVASDAITPCKGRWKTCLRGAGGSHLSPPPQAAGHGRLGPAVLPSPSARDAHCGGEDGAGYPRSTSPSSGNAAAPFPALPISRSISWGAERQLAALASPDTGRFLSAAFPELSRPVRVGGSAGNIPAGCERPAPGEGLVAMLPAGPRVPGGPGDPGPGQGRSPHASWENVLGRLGGEHGALCRHGNGMQMCQLLFFSFLSFFFHLFFFYLSDIIIHIMFQLLGLAAEMREALCLAKRSAPQEPSGPGGCTLEGCTQQRDPFPGHSPAATDKSNSHHARKVITLDRKSVV